MATKKAKRPVAKKPAKRKAAARRPSAAASKVTKSAITFRLTPAEVKKAQECLARTGTIQYTFKDVRITKLPHVLDDGKLID
jgi:hypothetical protein